MNISTQLDSPQVRHAQTELIDNLQAFMSHRFLSSHITYESLCHPETRPSQVITWEPVILPLLERLAELRSAPEDLRWPNADWPQDMAFLDAGKFAEQLPVPLKAAPHISLADDGEVNFSWSQVDLRIDLGFYGTGTYSFYARDKTGKEWFGDDVPVQSPLPAELRLLLAI